jgi:hypothetical protein
MTFSAGATFDNGTACGAQVDGGRCPERRHLPPDRIAEVLMAAGAAVDGLDGTITLP